MLINLGRLLMLFVWAFLILNRFHPFPRPLNIFVNVALVFMVLMIASLYLVGGKDVSKYKYILGFPQWIFNEIIILIAMVVAVILVVTFVYRDMDVTPNGKLKERKHKEGK